MNLKGRLVFISTVWLAGTLAYGCWTVATKLALPPTGDLYAHTVSFQVIQFIMFKGPSLVCLLLVSLMSQVFLARAHQSDLGTSSKRVVLLTFWSLVALAVAGMVWASLQPVRNYKPYFHPVEQQVLQFMVGWLPLLGLVGAAVLITELRWLMRIAR